MITSDGLNSQKETRFTHVFYCKVVMQQAYHFVNGMYICTNYNYVIDINWKINKSEAMVIKIEWMIHLTFHKTKGL